MSNHAAADKLLIINQENSPINLRKILISPPSTGVEDRGNNILHFNSANRGYEGRNASATEFVKTELVNAEALESDSEILQFAVRKAREFRQQKKGTYLEFGFCTGRTINFIAALAYYTDVWGFDSCEGLPEDWRGHFEKEKFKMILHPDNSGLPYIPFVPLANVKLVIGEISKTLPVFIRTRLEAEQHVELLHIDTDIYRSAKTVYRELDDRIVPGVTVVVLDEGYNYFYDERLDKGESEWKEHEYKATHEFARRKGYRVEYLAYNKTHQQLVLRFMNGR
ncbi:MULTISPECIES: hypothetical protein [Spirosoma]|uniref:Class I SAM-dependent methyltransferase n=1 Tax=Spirosoma sordidisoli TaxID=2502893 RepID=A0A4Q2UQT9_9BACT|nr:MULTISPECIES: hypothetical protein [Spirosoma]RYC69169.1 hypothetical protein EQG79_17380 [Spirosoma sordidisoli]